MSGYKALYGPGGLKMLNSVFLFDLFWIHMLFFGGGEGGSPKPWEAFDQKITIYIICLKFNFRGVKYMSKT